MGDSGGGLVADRSNVEVKLSRLNRRKLDAQRWVPALVVLIALSGVVFVALDWTKIRPALAQASWRPIPAALLATAISYLCIGVSFARVSQLLGVTMRTVELTIVGFVSSVLNHLVLSGGAAGYSVRFMLMNRQGVTMRAVIAISILHFYLTALWMNAMLPVSIIYLSLSAQLNPTTSRVLTISGGIILLGMIVTTLLIFGSRSRKRVTGFLARSIRAIARRDVSASLANFDATMDQGLLAMRTRPSSVVLIAVLVVLDWVFSAAALYYCFRALDLAPSVGQVVSGFVIGTMAGVASVLPGGLGVQEASMTGIFALYGFPVERAALVAVLYRLVYTIVPYLVSLSLYNVVLKRQRQEDAWLAKEARYEDPPL